MSTPRSGIPGRLGRVVIVFRRRDREARRAVAATADHAHADFHGRRLVAMDLRRKSFREANLCGADLTESDLEHADLRGANLRSTYLTGAQLVGADLTGACLDGAYLIAANFRHAQLDGVSLDHAIWDEATTWPDGRQDARGPVGCRRP